MSSEALVRRRIASIFGSDAPCRSELRLLAMSSDLSSEAHGAKEEALAKEETSAKEQCRSVEISETEYDETSTPIGGIASNLIIVIRIISSSSKVALILCLT